MPSTSEQADQSAQAAAPAPRSRLGRWAARRARQFLWVVCILAVGSVVTAAGIIVWRWSVLIGLPDVGDPFDVAALHAERSSEDQHALALMRLEAEKPSPLPALLPAAILRAQPSGRLSWSQSDPRIRAWAEANRKRSTLFRQVMERPDSIDRPARDWDDEYHFGSLAPYIRLTLLEGSRLEEQGDMEGAWGWFHAVLLMRVHVMRHGTVFQRYISDIQTAGLNTRIRSWAGDRRTEVPRLRRALEDVLAAEPRPEWDAHSLKLDYVMMMRALGPDGWVQHGIDQELDFRIGDMKLPPNITQGLHAARLFILNEPERSKRVLRLLFANWIWSALNAAARDRERETVVTFTLDRQRTLPLFAPGPGSPTSGRRIAPEDLASHLQSARDAKWLLYDWPGPGIRIAEKRHHADLVLMLAEELYRREHQVPPPSASALLGTYLDHLPDDGSEELDPGLRPRAGP